MTFDCIFGKVYVGASFPKFHLNNGTIFAGPEVPEPTKTFLEAVPLLCELFVPVNEWVATNIAMKDPDHKLSRLQRMILEQLTVPPVTNPAPVSHGIQRPKRVA